MRGTVNFSRFREGCHMWISASGCHRFCCWYVELGRIYPSAPVANRYTARKRVTSMHFKNTALCLLVFTSLCLPQQAFCAIAKSLNYDLEYGTPNAGSATATSGSYTVVSTITADGVAGQLAGSVSYSIIPAVGGSSGTAKIVDWSVY